MREKFKKFVPLDLTAFPDFYAQNRRDGDKDLLDSINSAIPSGGFKSIPYDAAIEAEHENESLKGANTSLEAALKELKQDLERAQEEKKAKTLEIQQLKLLQKKALEQATKSVEAKKDEISVPTSTVTSNANNNANNVTDFNFFDTPMIPSQQQTASSTLLLTTPSGTPTSTASSLLLSTTTATTTVTPSMPTTASSSLLLPQNQSDKNTNSAFDLLIGGNPNSNANTNPNTNTNTNTTNTNNNDNSNVQKKGNYNMVVINEETGIQSTSLNLSYDDKEREKLLIEHYEQMLAQVTKRAQLADTKAVEYQRGYDSVQAELANLSSELSTSKAECTKTAQALAKSQDDLESTRQNYESQMVALTEHIGGLNDMVAKLDEEITRLKGVRIQCGTCRGWNSLGYLITGGMNGKICSNGNHPTLSFMK